MAGDLQFRSSSTPGAILSESQGRLINCWAEKNGKQVLYRRVPGLSSLVDTLYPGNRGFFNLDGVLYVAVTGSLLRVTGTVVSVVGTLPGSDVVTMARNNRTTTDTSGNTTSTPDLVVVRSSGGAYNVDRTLGTMVSYPDANLPTTVCAVDFIGGYFMFTLPDGRMFASGLNTTGVNALSFATAESSADSLVRGIVSGGKFYAMGSTTIEPWLNVGNTPFPLARATSVIPIGLLTLAAVAGFQDGWGLQPIFVAQDGSVQELTGYAVNKISTPDVERFIDASTTATLEASVYTFNGNPVWALSSNIGTWEFNAGTRQWNERLSVGAPRWRASRSVKLGDDWLTLDTLSGKILKIDAAIRNEAGALLTWTLESASFQGFPARIAVPTLFANFTLGVGTVAVPNPVALISWSKDGGSTWSTPVTRLLGAAGATRGPMRVDRLGLASEQGMRVRLQVSDEVNFSFMGASFAKPEARAP